MWLSCSLDDVCVAAGQVPAQPHDELWCRAKQRMSMVQLVRDAAAFSVCVMIVMVSEQ